MHQNRTTTPIVTRVSKALVGFLLVVGMVCLGIASANAGPTVIGVDGTTVHIPIDILDGALDVNYGALRKLPGYDVVTVKYPRSFGILTLGGPGYDKSVAIGKAGTIDQIKKAQNGDPTVPVKLACWSQGADVCTQVNDQFFEEGYNQSSVDYLLFGNVDNAYGGCKVWIPKIGKNGIFIPGAGVTLGNATPTKASDAHITELLYEYDGFARAPEYPINILADLNAVAGTLLEHGSYRFADPNAPGNIVSTTPDGKITNIMIPVKEVPLLTVARFFGLPKFAADVINPTLKAIIDTGYGPVAKGPGTYPTEAVSMKLFPSKEKFQLDVTNVQKGLAESGEKLAAIFRPASPSPTTQSNHQNAVTTPIQNSGPPVAAHRNKLRSSVSPGRTNHVNTTPSSKASKVHRGRSGGRSTHSANSS